jgi:hypothetical protein
MSAGPHRSVIVTAALPWAAAALATLISSAVAGVAALAGVAPAALSQPLPHAAPMCSDGP